MRRADSDMVLRGWQPDGYESQAVRQGHWPGAWTPERAGEAESRHVEQAAELAGERRVRCSQSLLRLHLPQPVGEDVVGPPDLIRRDVGLNAPDIAEPYGHLGPGPEPLASWACPGRCRETAWPALAGRPQPHGLASAACPPGDV